MKPLVNTRQHACLAFIHWQGLRRPGSQQLHHPSCRTHKQDPLQQLDVDRSCRGSAARACGGSLCCSLTTIICLCTVAEDGGEEEEPEEGEWQAPQNSAAYANGTASPATAAEVQGACQGNLSLLRLRKTGPYSRLKQHLPACACCFPALPCVMSCVVWY